MTKAKKSKIKKSKPQTIVNHVPAAAVDALVNKQAILERRFEDLLGGLKTDADVAASWHEGEMAELRALQELAKNETARTMLNDLAGLLGSLDTFVRQAGFDTMREDIAKVDNRVREAVEHKPNRILTALVYRLRSVTQELADVYEQVERNNNAVESLCRMLGAAPTLQPMTAKEVGEMIDRRLEEQRRAELGGR